MGNRTGKSDTISGTTTSESYAVNAANMLTSRTVGGTTSSYTNDNDGNTLTGGGRTNTWDSQNRMVSCVNGTNTSAFTYGSDGIRHSSVVNGVSTDCVLDANMFIRELHTDPQTLLTSVKATYFMGASGPAYRRDDANGGTVRWYLYDGLGSVLGEVDPNGNITARRKYDVYGATRSGSDAGTSKHKFVGQLGHPSEDETGLIYMQARYMDPNTGRFVSQDPSIHGKNWFAYASCNPINRIDATGQVDKEIVDEFVRILEYAGMPISQIAIKRLLQGGVNRMMAYIEVYIERLLTGAQEDMLTSELAEQQLEAGGEELPGANAAEAEEVWFKGSSAADRINAVSQLYQLVLKLGMTMDDL